MKALTHPAPGNHEYGTPGATGYYGYWGAQAGDPTKGYYSYDLGTWHVIVLNSQCSAVACGIGSARSSGSVPIWPRNQHLHPGVLAPPALQLRNLARDNAAYQPFWQALYDFGADVVMNGHEHNYERFALQSPTGAADPNGVREFVAGTGGKSHYGFGTPIANSMVRDSSTFGVLKLTLHPTSYDWQFVPEAGGTFTDSGTANCVTSVPPPTGDFSLGSSPAKRTVTRGASTTYSVTITASGGFGDPVDQSISGLPAGTTASFRPDPATSASTPTVTTSPSTPTGNRTLTITGSSGSLSHTTSVMLPVKRN